MRSLSLLWVRAQPGLKQNISLALIVGGLAVLSGLLGGTYTSYRSLTLVVALLVFAPLIVGHFGAVPLLCIYAGSMWYFYTVNLYFLSDVLADATIFEIGIYLGLLVLVFWTPTSIRRRWSSLIATPLLLPLMVFAVGGVIAYATGPYSGDVESYAYLRRIVFYSLATYILIVNSIRQPSDAVRLLMALVVGGTFFATALSFYSGDWDFASRLMQSRGEGYSYPWGTQWEIGFVQVATYISTLLPVAVALAIHSGWRWANSLFTVASAMLGMMLLLSAGRGAWLAGSAGVAVVLFLSLGSAQASMRRIIAASSLVGVAVLYVFSSDVLSSIVLQRFASFASLPTEPSVTYRMQMWWPFAWDMLVSYPTGVGFLTYLYRYGLTAHNELLQLGLGTGFLGIAALMVFCAGVVRKCVSALSSADKATSTVCIATLGLLAAVLVNGISDNPSTNSPWTWPVMWVVISGAMAAVRVTSITFKHVEPSQ